MRARFYWPLSIAFGLGVAAVLRAVVGLHLGAVGFGFVYAVGLGLFWRAHFDLKSRVGSWKRPSLWSGAFAGLFTFTMLLVGETAGSDTDPLVVAFGLAGAAILGTAAGIGITLENLDAADAAE
ncbi:hypothetical protein I7X12_15215 [Halosimplex litoreum]|uniref:Uncharacterized protein n=1 Tax=Halosimplex litoreum TaxID=1198301 RepID=A0A7T3KUA6_9EURY|nr:hypothetical protein [Halosimplex litoreum]QPV62084.1 hypothetical protein I7X12_15215 [Halosimplex litoreum]